MLLPVVGAVADGGGRDRSGVADAVLDPDVVVGSARHADQDVGRHGRARGAHVAHGELAPRPAVVDAARVAGHVEGGGVAQAEEVAAVAGVVHGVEIVRVQGVVGPRLVGAFQVQQRTRLGPLHVVVQPVDEAVSVVVAHAHPAVQVVDQEAGARQPRVELGALLAVLHQPALQSGRKEDPGRGRRPSRVVEIDARIAQEGEVGIDGVAVLDRRDARSRQVHRHVDHVGPAEHRLREAAQVVGPVGIGAASAPATVGHQAVLAQAEPRPVEVLPGARGGGVEVGQAEGVAELVAEDADVTDLAAGGAAQLGLDGVHVDQDAVHRDGPRPQARAEPPHVRPHLALRIRWVVVLAGVAVVDHDHAVHVAVVVARVGDVVGAVVVELREVHGRVGGQDGLAHQPLRVARIHGGHAAQSVDVVALRLGRREPAVDRAPEAQGVVRHLAVVVVHAARGIGLDGKEHGEEGAGGLLSGLTGVLDQEDRQVGGALQGRTLAGIATVDLGSQEAQLGIGEHLGGGHESSLAAGGHGTCGHGARGQGGGQQETDAHQGRNSAIEFGHDRTSPQRSTSACTISVCRRGRT